MSSGRVSVKPGTIPEPLGTPRNFSELPRNPLKFETEYTQIYKRTRDNPEDIGWREQILEHFVNSKIEQSS